MSVPSGGLNTVGFPTDTFAETAKANNLEPYAYLQHVLAHIAAADTVEKLEALLPWNVKVED